ncbi:MAG: aminopeptidase P family protein [Bacilli bacterium]|nr:aminopeptidase P family protein [Bacilli bacterium]
MNQTFFKKNREKFLNQIANNSIAILFSGYRMFRSADSDFPFEVNKNFYYLTGINQEDTILVLIKGENTIQEFLFIEEIDELFSKWNGEKLSQEQAGKLSGIDSIRYLKDFSDFVYGVMNNTRYTHYNINQVYLDLERRNSKHFFSYALNFAKDLQKTNPEIKIMNAYNILISLRMIKETEEVSCIKESIEITGKALEEMMKHIKPHIHEYQVEAVFDYYIKSQQKTHAFPTIAASGKNATVLHYENNNAELNDGQLILFDLGCRSEFYCSDITRTYPIGKKFSFQQKQIYEIVLETNKKCIQYVKPGITWEDLNQYANSLLAKGLMNLGMIQTPDQLKQYYWHSIGHMLGLDTHDPSIRTTPFQAGMVLTIEPGLYLEELGIGIRIEDNVLVTANGCENLSKNIIKEVTDIEKWMSEM